MNIIFGAGGFAREVAWLMHEMARVDATRGPLDAFVASDDSPDVGCRIHGVEVLAESDFFERHHRSAVNVHIAVGSPPLRERLWQKCLETLTTVEFPLLVHPSVMFDSRPRAVTIGNGAIVCAGTVLTTDVQVGCFSHVNLNCTVGHDVVIGDFCTLSPGVHLSGRVGLGHGSFVGTGAVILENIQVPDRTVIGAGATVVATITEPGTYVGTPARRVK